MPDPRPSQDSASDAHDMWLRSLIRTATLVVVNSYDDLTNTATVSERRQPVDEKGRSYEAPPLRQVPVAWPRGGGWVDRGELAPGDLCVLLVMDRELAPQLEAPTGQVTSGETRAMHRLSDGIVIPVSVAHSGGDFSPAAGSRFTGRANGATGIKMTPGANDTAGTTVVLSLEIKLGGDDAVEGATKAETLEGKLVAAVTQAASLAVPQDGGLVALQQLALILGGNPPGSPATAVSGAGSEVVKVK